MLLRALRIHTSREIREIMAQARPRHTRFMTVWIRKKPQGPMRAVVICSRKVDARATLRNTVKRRIRSALVALGRREKIHADIVISAKPASTEASYQEILEALTHVISLS